MKIRNATDGEDEWLDEMENGSHSAYALVIEHDGREFGCKIVAPLGSSERLVALRDALIALTVPTEKQS